MKKLKMILLAICVVLAFSGCSSKESGKAEELEEQKKALLEENQALKNQISSLETEINALKKDNADLSAKIEELSAADSKKDDNSFVACVFDKEKDQIILSNESESYKLSIWLYGTQIEPGEYQVFGSDKETILEGLLLRNGVEQDSKATLFVNYSGETIKVSGSAQLYKPHSITKSGEILDFSYEGNLICR